MEPLSSLVLTRFRPDLLNGGAAMRNGQNIDGLSKLGPVDVVTVGVKSSELVLPNVRAWHGFPLDPRDNNYSLRDRLRENVLVFATNYYPSIDQYFATLPVQWLEETARRGVVYDVAVVEELVLAGYIPLLKQVARKVVFDAHNIENLIRVQLKKPSSPGSRLRGIFFARKQKRLRSNLERREALAATSSDAVWACSSFDAQLLRKCYGADLNVFVVPNAIELGAYESRHRVPETASWAKDKLTVAYVGSFSYPPNSEAALILINEIMPSLRQRVRQVKLLLVGRDPTSAMREAAEGFSDVEITGAIPSVAPYLDQACVLAMPIRRGSGTRLKILEGFASRRPIVTSCQGVEGIDATDGKELLVRDTVDGMVDGIIEVWQNTDLRVELCRNAWELARHDYSWERVARLIHGFVEEALGRD